MITKKDIETTYSKVKNNLNYQGFKKLLKKTTIEVYALSAIGLAAGFIGSYNYQVDSTKYIPLSFSEKTQIERDAKIKGEKPSDLTAYLTSVNDYSMKVFECYNMANEGLFINGEVRLARELEVKVDPHLKVHTYQIPDLSREINDKSTSLLKSFRGFDKINLELSHSESHFEGAWDDSHNDVYVPVLVTHTDTEGNVTTSIEMHYDHTNHYYVYNPSIGNIAYTNLERILRENSISLNQSIRSTTKTNAEGEYAADKSRSKKLKGKRLDSNKLIDIANSWQKNSTLLNEHQLLLAEWEDLKDENPKWGSQRHNAKSSKYSTRSSFDSGPKEFRTVESIKDHVSNSRGHITNMMNSIKYTYVAIPLIDEMIKDYIAIKLDNKHGDASRVKAEILKLTKQVYRTNFNRDFEVKDFSYGTVLFFSLLGLGLGALSGKFLNDYMDKLFKD